MLNWSHRFMFLMFSRESTEKILAHWIDRMRYIIIVHVRNFSKFFRTNESKAGTWSKSCLTQNYSFEWKLSRFHIWYTQEMKTRIKFFYPYKYYELKDDLFILREMFVFNKILYILELRKFLSIHRLNVHCQIAECINWLRMINVMGLVGFFFEGFAFFSMNR